MVKLKDKEGKIVEFPHAVDAREAIMSGNFFNLDEEKKVEEAPAKAEGNDEENAATETRGRKKKTEEVDPQ